MTLVLLFFLAFTLGVLSAMPLGGSQIEMAKRAVTGNLQAAHLVVLGSISSDFLYGLIALFGLAPFLENKGVTAAFHAAGAVILWILAFLTYRESRKPQEIQLNAPSTTGKRRAYFTGFSLAFSNPPMILNWLMGITIAERLELVSRPLQTADKLTFLAGGVLGLFTYLASLGLVIFRMKHFLPTQALGKLYRGLAIALFLASFYFVFGVVRYLNTIN